MKNVQISVDEDLLKTVDRFAKSARTTRSAVVREALKSWLREQEIQAFEAKWIESARLKPDDPAEADAWADSQQWSET